MTREQKIQGLRDAADLYERHPELPMPHDIDLNGYVYGDNAREQLATVVRLLGRTRKNYVSDTLYFERVLAGTAGLGVRISVGVEREKVCRRIVKTETVPAKPARTVEIPAEPEKVVEKVEWECSEPLLA